MTSFLLLRILLILIALPIQTTIHPQTACCISTFLVHQDQKLQFEINIWLKNLFRSLKMLPLSPNYNTQTQKAFYKR